MQSTTTTGDTLQKACTVIAEDIITDGPVHNLLAAKGLDRLHSFSTKKGKVEVNILNIEWPDETVAKIWGLWKDSDGKDQSGEFYYFTQIKQGVVTTIDTPQE